MLPRRRPDDLYTPTIIDGSGTVYLPAAYVREQAAMLTKAAKISGGKIFSDYATTQSQTGPGIDKPLEGLSFAFLRQMADVSPIDRLIIDTRLMQIKRVARRAIARSAVGFRVEHVRHNDPDFDVPDGIKTLCRELEELISTPQAPFHQHFQDFLVAATQEELEIDRKVMIISRDRAGRPIKYSLRDGATIRPVPLVIFEAIQKEYTQSGNQTILSYDTMQQYLSEQSGFDLANAAYVQMVDAKIVAAWKDDEVSVDITNPSVRLNQWGYGKSLLEKSYRLTDGFLKAWNYNLELFKLNYPEAVLTIVGDYDQNGLMAFKKKLLGEGSGRDNNWRLPVITLPNAESQVNSVKLRDSPKDMLFGEFMQAMVNLKCAAYRMHPSMINFSQTTGGGQAGITIGVASEEDQVDLAQEEGWHSLLESHSDWLTRVIIREWHADLHLVWQGIDKVNEKDRIEILTQKVQAYMTPNEARKAEGMAPLPEGVPENPGDFVGGTYLQAVQILQQASQMAAQQGGPGYDEGDFGSQPPQQSDGAPFQDGKPKAATVAEDQGAGAGAAGSAGARPRPAPSGLPTAPQSGGPQHLDQEAGQLQRSLAASTAAERATRFLRIEVYDD